MDSYYPKTLEKYNFEIKMKTIYLCYRFTKRKKISFGKFKYIVYYNWYLMNEKKNNNKCNIQYDVSIILNLAQLILLSKLNSSLQIKNSLEITAVFDENFVA